MLLRSILKECKTGYFNTTHSWVAGILEIVEIQTLALIEHGPTVIRAAIDWTNVANAVVLHVMMILLLSDN